jgi:hypothetical protein
MGRSVNKVILLGRAGKDPSVHILRTGTIVNLSLATSERYRDIHGDWQEHTEWHNLVGFQRVGEILHPMAAATMWSTTSAVRALRNPSSARNRRLRRRKYPIDPSAE